MNVRSNVNDKTWLDFNGHPHSEALHVTERFRRTDFGRMLLTMTFDDPKAYRRPWTIEVPVRYLPDTDLIEHVCLENEKDRAGSSSWRNPTRCSCFRGLAAW